MLVEAIFWFYPVVWWMRTRLIEERERACDEEVLRLGCSPRVYAESILKVCELYLVSPVTCVAGVSGANLKRRIEAIMRSRVGRELSRARMALLVGAGLAAVAGPLLMGLNNASLLRAQSSSRFEVASIKPHKAFDRSGAILPEFQPGGRFVEAGWPLQLVIAYAWNLPWQAQLSGGPDWIRGIETMYDFEARASTDALKGLSPAGQSAKMRLMLQVLLIERFQRQIRKETREQPVYILTAAKSGPKLQLSKLTQKDCDDAPDQCHQGGAGQGRGIHAKGFSMPELALSVSNFTDHPLLDRTGLTGLYDIDTEGRVPMRSRPSPPPGTPLTGEALTFADPSTPTLYQIFDRLGLKMESSRAVVDDYVIVSIEKPTGN